MENKIPDSALADRAVRSTRGIPADKYPCGDAWISEKRVQTQIEGNQASTSAVTSGHVSSEVLNGVGLVSDSLSIRSGGSIVSRRSSASTVRRRRHQVELEAQQEMLRLAKEKRETDRIRHQYEADLERQKIDNEVARVRRDAESAEKVAVLERNMIESAAKARMAEIDEELDLEADGSISRGIVGVEDWLGKSDNQNKLKSVGCQMEDNPVIKESQSDLAAAFNNIADVLRHVGLASDSQQNNNKQFLARQSIGRDLPSFSGEPEEWPIFSASFKQSNECCQFSDVENVIRLQKALHGNAKKEVQAMMVSPKNVDKIMATLERRFGRPDLIISVLIDKVRKVSPPRSNNMEDLIAYASLVNSLTATVENLDRPAYLSNPELIQDLVRKLPDYLKLSWGRELAKLDETGTLRHFAQWLDIEAEAASFVSIPSVNKDKIEVKQKSYGSYKDKRRNEMILNTTATSQVDSSCVYCKKTGHKLCDCFSFAKADVKKRRRWASKSGVCFNCLEGGHQYDDCKKHVCGLNGCVKTHHKLLHVDVQGVTSKTEEALVNHLHSRILNKVYLKITPVRLFGPRGEVSTYAMLDEGSTTTLLDESIADQLGLEGQTQPVVLRFTNSVTRLDQESRLVNLKVTGTLCDKKFNMVNIRTVRNLELPVQTVKVDKLANKWKHLKQVQIHSLVNAKPMILIGADNCELITSMEMVKGPRHTPILSKTALGWIIHGNATMNDGRIDNEFTLHVCHQSECDEALHQLVKESFKTENFGVKTTEEKPRSREDLRAFKILEETTKLVGDRYETGLLWKEDRLMFSESKVTAFRRLQTMERKMDKDPVFAELYCEKIQDYVRKGYAVKLSKYESRMTPPWTRYLPHFAHVNPNKPGKIRFVFDAAAKSHGVSLNDKLIKGPDLLNSLVAVLMKFRTRSIGFVGDIREMFHQVVIREKDRDAQRFLWRGMDRFQEPNEYRMNVMIFGATCSPCSAHYVKNNNAEQHKNEFPDAAVAIIDRHYVDDYLGSAWTVDEAIKIVKDVIEVHRRGGFEIGNWICSNKEVLNSIPSEMRAGTDKTFEASEHESVERVLGLHWKPNNDEFIFTLQFNRLDTNLLQGLKRPTKREVLRVLMSVYDPLGFVAHFLIKGKILLQDIWRLQLGWDDELTEKLDLKWKNWLMELNEVKQCQIPRCYSTRRFESTTLHVFCDASEKSFAAVSYLQTLTKDGLFDVSFVIAKTRVSPLKPISIPRLELQAAVMGTRMAHMVQGELQIEMAIERTVFWTDSKTVLCWIRSDARTFKTFVSHRIGEILETTDVAQWRWISTLDNVADEATRETSSAFHPSARWYNGPAFLKKSESDWPKEKEAVYINEINENELEIKQEYVNVVTSCSQVLPEVTRFSNFCRLIRTTAWIIRYVNCLRMKRRGNSGLSANEVEIAKKKWWQKVQWDSYSEEMTALSLNNNNTLSKSSKLFQLDPFLDSDGVMRMRGRISSAPGISDATKYPVILDAKHPFTKLLIMDFHKKAGHQGQERVFNEMRQQFWISNMRAAIRGSWNHCNLCRIKRTLPKPPGMGDLPTVRLTPYYKPFTFTGVDYFGPMEVTIGRRRENRYGVLFTCLVVRAIHLEIAETLSTDSAILAIRRFLARRGKVQKLYSDNGTNLRGAHRELKTALEVLQHETIQDNLATNGIEWHFIPPATPHMGGCWERMIQSVKKALAVTLRARCPRLEVLQTLFVEAEYIVNSRPLTHVPIDATEPEALTPNHFLMGSSSGITVPGIFDDNDLSLRRQWRISQRLADHFWKRWVKEYIPTLVKRNKWHGSTQEIQIGDPVFIADGNLPRANWPKGVIEAVYPGKDGCIRVVDVKTTRGTYRRPVHKLCVLRYDNVM